MQQSLGPRHMTAPAVGLLLIAVGVAVLLLRETGFNVFTALGAQDWPLLIVAPGVVLLAASVVPAPPRGVGFASGGATVTMVGAILLYQSRTGHWESWAYAWALIPAGAGIAILLYGLFARERGMVRAGLTMAGIAGALFLAGAWFFEGLFAGEPRPTDVGAWWPVGVIVLGGVIVLRALLFPALRSSSSGGRAEGPAGGADQVHVP